jgi:putative DNA primase/helicase
VLPPGPRKRGSVEVYDRLRYFTISGRRIGGMPATIEPRQCELDAFYAQYFPRKTNRASAPACRASAVVGDDSTLLGRALCAKNGGKFARLWRGDWHEYPSPSEADLALVDMLVFWTNGDLGRADTLFRQSGLFRDKWDERRGDRTYGEITLAKALDGCLP